MCTGAPGTARNRVKGVSRAAENSAFTELTVKFLELNHTNLHNYLKRLPSLHTYENDQDQAVRKSEHVHLAHVPRCQRRRRWGARSAPWREIEFSNSRVKYHSIHLSTIFMLGLISLRFYLFRAETIEYTRNSTEHLSLSYISGCDPYCTVVHSRGTSLQQISTLVYYTINKYITVQDISRSVLLYCILREDRL